MKILLIDNYDSFTFNLYHYLSSFKINVDVIRNDKISEDDKGNLFGPNNDLDNILNSLKLKFEIFLI